jgi:hypothetical protein
MIGLHRLDLDGLDLDRLKMEDCRASVGDAAHTPSGRKATNRQPGCRFAHGKVSGSASGCLTASAAAAPSI